MQAKEGNYQRCFQEKNGHPKQQDFIFFDMAVSEELINFLFEPAALCEIDDCIYNLSPLNTIDK